MSDQYWLTEAQLARIAPHFQKSRGIPRVDVYRVISGILHVIRNGMRWRDAPTASHYRVNRVADGRLAKSVQSWVSSS